MAARAVGLLRADSATWRRPRARWRRPQGFTARNLAIAKRLAAVDPANTRWQRNLSVSYNKLGDVAAAQGHPEEAARLYGEALEIRKRLVAAVDRTNTQWQRELSVSYERLGDVAAAQGQMEEAARLYGEDLEIRERLAAADRTNTQWQRELSVSYNKLGDVAAAQGHPEEAARLYGDGLEIRERLAAADPDQHPMAAQPLGVLRQAAAAWWRPRATRRRPQGSTATDLEIREHLAAADPTNTRWQRDLSLSYNNLGDVAAAQSPNGGGRTALRRGSGDSRAPRRRLTRPTPDVAARLCRSPYWKLADLAGQAEQSRREHVATGSGRWMCSRASRIGACTYQPEDRQRLETLRLRAGAAAPSPL